jgi:hypothetical protein
MPSPFPGVDPYIENQGLWSDCHPRVITRCSEVLNTTLPEHYAARIEEQVRLVIPDDPKSEKRIRPDVGIDRGGRSPTWAAPAEAVATLEPTTMTVAIEPPYEIRERWIEIIRYPERSLVTVIELLSPSNKESSGRGEYLDKRRRILQSPAHLVEIDLLIAGRRPPMWPTRPWPAGEYYALISKAEDRPDCQVYGWSVRRAIPPIPIPLAAPDPDVMLDLASLLAHAYEYGRYRQVMRYDQPLDLPLDPEQLAWAEDVAKTAQAR